MPMLSNGNFPKTVFIVLSTCVIITTLLLVAQNDLISNVNLLRTSNFSVFAPGYVTNSSVTATGYVTNSSVTAPGYVTLGPIRGRLGNQMFNFAVLFYVAVKTRREVVLFNGHTASELEKYFSLGVRKINRSCPCFTFHERLATYDIRIEKAIRSQKANTSQTIILRGVYGGWKYIQPVHDLVRIHLKFHNSVEDLARDILIEITPDGWTEGNFTRVGIHNRRGDFLATVWSLRGFTTAPKSYFKKAMKYFADQYEFVQFIVTSDDMKWSRKHIKYDSKSSFVNVTYLEKHSPGQDMAMLSLCDHVIMSTGTYGWMAAWLANGETVYYSNYPRNGSYLSRRCKRLDFFPSHWIPMS